jgi:hypothetical protein
MAKASFTAMTAATMYDAAEGASSRGVWKRSVAGCGRRKAEEQLQEAGGVKSAIDGDHDCTDYGHKRPHQFPVPPAMKERAHG